MRAPARAARSAARPTNEVSGVGSAATAAVPRRRRVAARSLASSANARRSATSELAQQRRDVALDGAHGEVQPAGDLLVGQVLADQREHLGLTLGDAGVGEGR